jgi:predicted aconitase with swiveling domain
VNAPVQNSLTASGILYPGSAEGPLLKLSAPLSFWGGVDPQTGEIILGSHPERGRTVKGVVLALADPIGSSSSSYIMLELIHNGVAPAAVLLGEPDAILIVGCLVAREMGYPVPPILHVERGGLLALSGTRASVANGVVETV